MSRDRRRHERHPVATPVHVTAGQAEGEGLLHDLSVGGASVGIAIDIPLGAEVRIAVEGLGEISGKVVRRREKLGVAFHAAHPEAENFAERVVRLVGAASKRHLVMVVEDSPTQAISLQAMLEEEDYKVVCLPTAEAALEVLATTLPDLIIVDYHLPGILGDELCRRLRLNLSTQSLPILMLTADRDQEAELRGLESGANDYVRKSDDPDIFRLRVHALLRDAPAGRPGIALRDIPFHKPRLLLIDDSKTWLMRLAADLEKDGEFEIDTAVSGSQGLERAQAGTFDCILTDMVMGDLDGAAVAQRLASMRKGSSHAPAIIVLSGHETKENAALALEAGANDFIGKSASLDVLKARIRAALRQIFLHEQHRGLIDILHRQKDDLERMVAERTQELRNEIEERRRIEDDLRHAKEMADAANRAKSEFLANMSHELRTPLTAIIGFAEMIHYQAGGAPEALTPTKLAEYIETIVSSGHHLLSIINDVLDLARIEGGRIDLSEETVEVSELLNRAWRFMRPAAEKRKIGFEAKLPATTTRLWVDARLMTQALLNLFSNAVKFSPDGGRISVAVSAGPGKETEIAVTDQGIGIAEQHLDEVLRPFGQVESAHARNYQGTGLGLPIAKSFIELHGGRLAISSQLGEGTRVTLALPAERTR